MGSSIDLSQFIKLAEADAREHKEHVADLLDQQRIAFPGAQPVSFARKHIKELERQDYFMCEKTDGHRVLLYLHQFLERSPDPSQPPTIVEAQFLIDRKNDYYFIPRDALHIPTRDEHNPKGYELIGSHTGTILDGELVIEHYRDERGPTLTYLIFDCLCLDGQSLTDRTYDKRLGKMQMFVFEPWLKFANDYPNDVREQPFQLRLKETKAAYSTEVMFKEVIPRLRHGNDGLIFTCKSSKYVAGTDQHILKWKPPHENTVDFRLQLGAFPKESDDEGEYIDWDACPDMELLVNTGSTEEHFADLFLTPQEWAGFKSLNQQIDHRILECWRDATTEQWRPKMEADGTPRFRDDKKDANYIKTVESVLESIEDAVSESDLLACSSRIRDAWKKREASQRRHDDEQKKVHAQERDRQRPDGLANGRRAEPVVEDDGPGYD